MLKPIALLDILRNDSDLQSWTRIPSFSTLNNIVKCEPKISSACVQLKKFKLSVEFLIVLVTTKDKLIV